MHAPRRAWLEALCLGAACLTAALLPADPAAAQQETWLSPRARAQLAMDPAVIPKGKGLLFVPTMSAGYREPSFRVLAAARQVASAPTGSAVLLDPGTYLLAVGSGTDAQMMQRPVEVREGYSTLIEPWWAGLTVDVIDETRTPVKEAYELFAENQDNLGIGYGVEEERGEAVDTWLLAPGNYTIVKVGQNVATPRKLSVRLLPGELVQRNLVIDDSGEFVGFYAPGYLQQGDRIASPFSSRWELSMSPQFTASQNTAGEDRSRLSFAGEIHNRTRYAGNRHYGDVRLILEEGFTEEGWNDLRKTVDELEARATYILRVSRTLGPYLRGVLNSKLFPTEVRFDAPQDVTVRASSGALLDLRQQVTRFRQSPALYPLQLRQGVGINSHLYRSYPLNLDVRLGIGARQTLNIDTYALSQDRRTATELDNASSSGLEALVIMDARPGRHLGLDCELDVLMASARADSWEFTFENRVRTYLTANASMDVVFDFRRQKPLRRVQSSQQVLLRVLTFL